MPGCPDLLKMIRLWKIYKRKPKKKYRKIAEKM